VDGAVCWYNKVIFMSKENVEPQKGPQFLKFFNPILEVLRGLGGSGSVREVRSKVIEEMKIPDILLEEKLKSGAGRVENQIAWARIYLVKCGYIELSQRGVWTLTDKGWKASHTSQEVYQIFKGIHQTFITKGKKVGDAIANVKEDEEPNPDIYNHRIALIERLRKLTPKGFERICQKLLRESGFQEVEVTGRTNDGGIDGNGILALNPLVTFKVLFQCKRYEGAVNPSQVRDFRGAMQGRADKGIILTTGRFSTEAKKEAIRDGVPPIELVDAEKLAEMFESLQLGLKPRTVYEIDEEFFDDFA
jgi:restriction system protein